MSKQFKIGQRVAIPQACMDYTHSPWGTVTNLSHFGDPIARSVDGHFDGTYTLKELEDSLWKLVTPEKEAEEPVIELTLEDVAEARIDEVKHLLYKGYFIPEMEVYAEDRIAQLTPPKQVGGEE